MNQEFRWATRVRSGGNDRRIPESEPARLRVRRTCIIWAGDTLGALDTQRIATIGRELDQIDIFELDHEKTVGGEGQTREK